MGAACLPWVAIHVSGREGPGGCSICVKKGIPHEVLELDTELQAVAVKVSITVCNVYIPPCFNVVLFFSGGCSICVKKGIPHEVLLDTELQAVAVKVSITVCNVYIPPCFNVVLFF